MLPTTTWNGRLLGTGNGGFAGSIQYGPLRTRSAAAMLALTDMDFGAWGTVFLADIRKVSRLLSSLHALHDGRGKTLIQAFYGSEQAFSYFQGCSTGAQGVAEAQIYQMTMTASLPVRLATTAPTSSRPWCIYGRNRNTPPAKVLSLPS